MHTCLGWENSVHILFFFPNTNRHFSIGRMPFEKYEYDPPWKGRSSRSHQCSFLLTDNGHYCMWQFSTGTPARVEVEAQTCHELSVSLALARLWIHKEKKGIRELRLLLTFQWCCVHSCPLQELHRPQGQRCTLALLFREGLVLCRKRRSCGRKWNGTEFPLLLTLHLKTLLIPQVQTH